MRDEDVAGPRKDTQSVEGQGGAIPAKRSLTGSTSRERKKQEATLISAIQVMELNLNPEFLNVHEVLLHQMLQNLETEHNSFVMEQSLDINKELEKSYMLEFEGKVSRALKKQRIKLQSQGTRVRNPSTASRTLKGPELLQEIKSQRREKTATSSIRIGHAELRARSTKLRPRHLDQLEEKRTILEESEEGKDDELRAEETATGRARDHEHKEPNVTSMEPGAPINEGYQYNEPGDSLPNRARTLMEELENTQTKITGREDPETEDESQVGVPEETKQEDHRGTEEATGYGQTTYEPGYQMWKTVGTVTSQQTPTNPKQHPKRRIFKPQPTYQQLGVEMKGTKLSPGPSLLGGFPKQGLAKEKNQQQARHAHGDEQAQPSRPWNTGYPSEFTDARQVPHKIQIPTVGGKRNLYGKSGPASCHGYNHVLPCHS